MSNEAANKKPVRQPMIGLVIALLAGSALLAIIIVLRPPVSKPPVTRPLAPQSSAANYAQEFNQPHGLGNGSKDWVSPDGKWELSFVEEHRDFLSSESFFSLRLQDHTTTKQRLLFTLWDADPGSGICFTARWSNDAKALELKGDTRGFNYDTPRTAMTCESFDYIYLVDEDNFYDAPSVKTKLMN